VGSETLSVLLIDSAQNRDWAERIVCIVRERGRGRYQLQQASVTPETSLAVQVEQADLIILTYARDTKPAPTHFPPHDSSRRRPVLVVTDLEDADALSNLVNQGCSDFLHPPVRPAELLFRLSRCLKTSPQNLTTADVLNQQLGLSGIIGNSDAIKSQVEKVRLYARCDAAVLISGETGTGKEVFAQALHYISNRAGKPFRAINCGALPSELIENELFGHASGAFTGARSSYAGFIEQAEGGTLFLDEIDSLPLAAQAKLLRFLQNNRYHPLGSTGSKQADVRVISAANVDLPLVVRANQFRPDLYFRLNILALHLPPLRERRLDIPLLATHLLLKHGPNLGRRVATFSAGAIAKLVSYDWPGNVRELENVIQRALVLSRANNNISEADLDIPTAYQPAGQSFKSQKARAIQEFERRYLEEILAKHSGSITDAANAAAKDRRTFFALLQKHRMVPTGRETVPAVRNCRHVPHKPAPALARNGSPPDGDSFP
jgi:DNA-binding NtrC family response regulator